MNAPVTLVLHIGTDTSPAVQSAVRTLLKVLTEDKQLVTVERRGHDDEPAFGLHELKRFFVESGAVTPEQAYGFAERALRNLLDRFLNSDYIVAICRRCQKQNGQCRCVNGGGVNAHGQWEYSSWPSKWRVTHASLLRLNEEDFAQLSQQTRVRLRPFQEHLRSST